MKLGFSTVMYEGTNLLLSHIISKAATLGYEGVELNFRERPSTLDVNEIRGALKTFSIRVAAIGTRHMHITHGLYLASPHGKVREEAVTYITECMDLANKLNCSTVQAGWAFQGSKLEAPFETMWKNAVQSLKEVGRRALNYGVNFVIEYQNKNDAKLVNTMEDALRILGEVGCDSVLVMADTFHMNLEDPSPEESILKAEKRLGYVHLADSCRLAPGEGCIDFRGFIRALRKIGYEGYLVMEFEPKPNPDDALGRAIKFIGSLL